MTNVYEIKTNDTRKSRAKNLKYQGVSIFDDKTTNPCHGEFSIQRKIIRNGDETTITETVNFRHGLLQNRRDSEGLIVPAYRTDFGDAEYFENGLLHRENGPAVICDWGNWEEWWHQGSLVMIRTTNKITSEIARRLV